MLTLGYGFVLFLILTVTLGAGWGQPGFVGEEAEYQEVKGPAQVRHPSWVWDLGQPSSASLGKTTLPLRIFLFLLLPHCLRTSTVSPLPT